MIISIVQQSDSVIHLHTFILFQILFPYRLSQNIQFCSLCSLCLLYSSSRFWFSFILKFYFISSHAILFAQQNSALHFLFKSYEHGNSWVSFTFAGGQTIADKEVCYVCIPVVLFILKITYKGFSPLNHFFFSLLQKIGVWTWCLFPVPKFFFFFSFFCLFAIFLGHSHGIWRFPG